MDNPKVFHRLEHITKELDQAIKSIRLANIDKKMKVKNWIVLWFLLPFISMTNLKSITKIKNFDMSPGVPLYSGLILYPFLMYILEINIWILALLVFSIAYTVSFVFLAPRAMCNFKSKYFRIDAYVAFRHQEYELFKSALAQEDEFYFSSIPNELQLIIQNNQHYKKIFERLDTFLIQEKRELLIELEKTKALHLKEKEEYRTALTDFDEEVENLFADISDINITLKYLFEFIKSTNTALYRLKNNCFSVSDIVNMIGTGITIYELVEGNPSFLKKIHDEGTSGASPKIISLDSGLATAEVVLNNDFNEHMIDEPQPGRFVVSRLFKMGYNKVWVINFHPDNSAEKALLLTIPNEELNTQEIIRVVHSMCLLMQENDHKKGG